MKLSTISDRDQKRQGHNARPTLRNSSGGVLWLAIQLAVMAVWTAVAAWLWSA